MKIQPKMPCSNSMSPWRQIHFNRKVHKLLKRIRKSCEPTEGVSPVFVLLLVTVVMATVIIILLWLLLVGDKCDGQKIKQKLCQDYNEGLITGDLCYSICIDKTISLRHCFTETANDITYRYDNTLIKLQRYPATETLLYPISLETFQYKVSQYLKQNLGPADTPQLLDQIMQFTDFNGNGELDFAESNSLWQLLHVRQFFILMIFQEETTFPQLNGTCGSAFGYDYISSTPLYQKKKDGNPIMQYFFPNYNHWLLPSWEKRANIAVGLLELASTLTESHNSKFFMCNINPFNFGVSVDYEAKVVDFDSLLSEQQLLQSGAKKHCYFDSECYYGNGCSMVCDSNTRTCSNIPKRPIVSVICDILKDYILFDSPDEFKYHIESLLSQCQSLTFKNQTIPQNVIPAKIKEVLWDQVKNKPVNWLNSKKSQGRAIKSVPKNVK